MTSPGYFEELYEKSADPWRLAENDYELRKFEITAACLPRRRYANAFEPGCSIGVLTQLLASRCDQILSMDQVPRAVLLARERIDDASVTIRSGSVPADWPEQSFDLIVISEVLYFLHAADRKQVNRRSLKSLTNDGHLVLVHWRHRFEEAQCTGDEAHAEVASTPAWKQVVTHVEADFRLDIFTHAGSHDS